MTLTRKPTWPSTLTLGRREQMCLGRDLFVPTIYLLSPKGREVHVIGMSHLGKVSFFDEVQLFLRARELHGAVIQYEALVGSRGRDQDDAQTIAGTLLRPTHHMAYQYGPGGISIGAGWVNTDMQGEEFLRRLHGRDADLDVIRSAEHEKVQALRLLTKRELLVHIERDMAGVGRYERRPAKETTVVIDQRNEIAVAAIKEVVVSGRDVATIWGAAHVYGILCGLIKSGFVPVAELWRRYWTIESYEVLRLLHDTGY